MSGSPIVATGVGCVVVGLVAGLFGAWRRAPAMALVVPAVTPLLPGLALFEALQALTAGGSASVGVGITGLLGAGAVALSIGAGVVLGDQLADVAGRRVPRRR